jgi:hypothetical protein
MTHEPLRTEEDKLKRFQNEAYMSQTERKTSRNKATTQQTLTLSSFENSPS